ncbi:MAG: RNA ligase partner protein [Desulfobacteraceae bacterium]|nr:RNA ligase partner protein [Desulfobacteraceae bacterium]
MAETGNKTKGHEPSRSKLVVDTSIFVNPEAMELFGDSVSSAIEGFLDICRKFSLEIYMPLSIFRELSTFAQPEAIKTLRTRAVVRAPDLYNMQVPAITFHTFVRELRQRVNKGLHIAEKAIKSDDAPENVRWVRQHYREALRSGIVDSVEDLEVVLLAREVGGIILTADQGIANMADSFGIEVFRAQEFLDYCNDTIKE